MKVKNYTLAFLILTFLLSGNLLFGQTTIKGKVVDENSTPLVGASIYVLESGDGTSTDIDGNFELKTNQEFPFYIQISYLGYEQQEIELTEVSDDLVIKFTESSTTLGVVIVPGQKIDERQKASPLTRDVMDFRAIRQTASDNPYDGMAVLKGVDSYKAGLAFTIINTRGFNSTSPVRTLQIIDGVDNQAPGLNFSLGNFLGTSELDLLKIDLISGASSPFYGPNAFNGVISMETKNPFLQKGLSAIVKVGERNLKETAFRYADAYRNKDSLEFFAFKFNFSYMEADDWVADNYEAVYESRTDETNPGRWDAVNIYGDEPYALNDGGSIISWTHPGMGEFHRIGYMEKDLLDYDTKNYKANLALHLRTNPTLDFESPELIISSSFGSGTTVYQGDNRFSLKNILFFQNRLEFRKKDKWFIRAYATNEDAGDSYDPYFTALQLQKKAKSDKTWGYDYREFWKNNIVPQMYIEGYPPLVWNPELTIFQQDTITALAWINNNQHLLSDWHTIAANATNNENGPSDFFEPGTERFNEEFNRITSAKSNDQEKGTRFYDKSALYHLHGEYIFDSVSVFDHITLGGNGRLYKPDSDGTIFNDPEGIKISNWEVGAYLGIDKSFYDNKLRTSLTLRVDKNQNFNLVPTPAASLVWNPEPNTYFRFSFSSAIRNPTLSDQYLNLNVGPATLKGNLDGVDSLITEESWRWFRDCFCSDTLEFFSLNPVQTEKVKTFELGYRTTFSNSLYMDVGYYFNFYDDFLGYRIGIDAEFNDVGFPILNTLEAYRYAANSLNRVTTHGFTIGMNYYFKKYYQLSGNYSWNKLITVIDDPIIPAFNTPEHKFNLGFSGRDIDIPIGNRTIKGFGFNVNYKWIEGFLFEGSPQFTGHVPTYDLLDAQINLNVRKIHTTFKLGASNLLNNKQFQTYGGPKIGRLAYFSILYEFKKI